MTLPLTRRPRSSIVTAVSFRCEFSRKSIAQVTLLRFSVYCGRRSIAQATRRETQRSCCKQTSRRAPTTSFPGLPAPRAVRVARRMAPWVLGRAYGGAPVSDPLSGFRAYRLIVLKKALAEFRGRPFLETDGWASNVELLGLVAPHARRIAEAPLTLRYDVAARPSRLSAVRTLRGLLRVRRERWESHTREGK